MLDVIKKTIGTLKPKRLYGGISVRNSTDRITYKDYSCTIPGKEFLRRIDKRFGLRLFGCLFELEFTRNQVLNKDSLFWYNRGVKDYHG